MCLGKGYLAVKLVKRYVLWGMFAGFFVSGISSAQLLATFEVGDAVLPAYTTTATEATPFTTITFEGTFASPPNVFTLTPVVSGDPCLIRIRNVTANSFEATCLEPLSEDRNNPGTTFQYIAIADGGVTVPLSSGVGDVVFQSSCADITTQQYGNNCPACTGARSFTPITFSPAFNSIPAVLAQIQTANNDNGDATAPVDEPAFISQAVAGSVVSEVTATGLGLSIERLEAGQVATLAESERICYLATETTATCQSLDFSSLGGPTTPVMFQSIITEQNINGVDTGGETTNFAAGCFASTPVAVAGLVVRNGGDGAFLTSSAVNDTSITLAVDEDTIVDGRGHGADEQAAIMAFSEVFTTPVTLTSAQVSRLGRNATFDWVTSAETFHLGFNLWGETAQGWIQLNTQLIKGNGIDSGESQSYRQTVRLSRAQDNEISQFGISSVDNTGYEEFYGPFSEDIEYGEEANNEPVDWTSTRNAFEQSMSKLGYVKYNNRWFRVNSRVKELVDNYDLGVNRLHFNVQVDTPGIHSISVSDLITLNPSWENRRVNSIALTLNGQAVSRHIVSDDGRLSHDDRIIFNAAAVSGSDTPFLANYTYRLSADPTRVIDASSYDGTNFDGQNLVESALISERVTQRKLHSAGLTTGDPWYDTRLLTTGGPVSVQYNVDFDYPVDVEQAGVVEVVLFGSLDLPGDADDHHVQVIVNDQLVSDFTFDGLVGYRDEIEIPAGILTNADNVIRIIVVGDTGQFADVVLVDEVTVSAVSTLSSPSRTIFDFPNDENAEGYRITSNVSDDFQVYAYTNTGLFSKISAVNDGRSVTFSALPFEDSETNLARLRYSVASQWLAPSSIDLVEGQDIHTQETNYLIVAHPTFMGEELDDFVQFKTDLGYNVRVVDWLEIVQTYGYGNNTPQALDNFLKAANELYSTENVLIVGGHTFDYFGITNESVVNFIPSHYERVSVFEYTATDNPYADLDGDNVPEIAIGRWPVRSIADLQAIINKTKTWHENRENDQYQSAYLLAQATDSQNLSFAEQLEGRVALPLSQLAGIDSVNQLNINELPDSVTDVVSYTREKLAEQINSGTELISFSGHASQTAWGFQNIVNTGFVQNLENQGEPVLLMPLACYITHYEDVSTNTLAHQWLFAGEQGAAAIHGASVLGEYRENGLFAERYIKQSKGVDTVGQAILKAKQTLGTNNEILHNWILLGDPTLPIR